MVGTIMVHGSDGEVMAPMCDHPGEFYLGKPRMIKITRVGPDENTPIGIRQGLVDVSVRAMFDRKYLCRMGRFQDVVPEGALVAYVEDIVDALKEAGKQDVAEAVWEEGGKEPLALYVFEPGTFEVLE